MQDVQIVVLAGGLGTRLKHRTHNGMPKALLEIGNKKIIDYCIELFTKNGFKNFVFLIGYKGETLKDYIEENYKDINKKYSMEEKKLGKGGAIKQALDNNIIDRTKPCIITYPDDLILMNDFPKQLTRRHNFGKEKGCRATVVRVNKTQYRYGVVKADDEGFVIDFEEKPFILYPANVGIYFLEPEVYEIIDKEVDLSRAPVDFEKTVVPKLVLQKTLFSFTIPHDSWIPINEEKEFRLAKKMLSKQVD